MNTEQESALTFPCDFPIKVMGEHIPEFQQRVVAIVRKHAPDLADEQVTARPSRNGRYVSVTVVVNATSKDQLDNIYRELTACEWVTMAL